MLEEIDQIKCLKTLELITILFVNRSYEALEALAGKRSLSAKELRQEAEEWKYPFMLPPEWTIDNLVYGGIRKRRNIEPSEWLIDMYLWTREEGKSDLTFSLCLRESTTILYQVEIENLHVL